MTGTLINVAAVIAGSSIGLLFHTKLPAKIVKIVFQGIGLFTLFIGFHLASQTQELLIMIFSMVIGSILGQWIDIDKYLVQFSNHLKRTIKSSNSKFSEGFVTSFLLFCIGSMTILGAIEEGLGSKPNLLLVKSLMDGISSIALASAMGIGVMFSVIPLLLYQGGLTLFAGYLEQHLNDAVIGELTAVGGILLIGLGIKILELKDIKVVNMLPALVIVVILSLIFL